MVLASRVLYTPSVFVYGRLRSPPTAHPEDEQSTSLTIVLRTWLQLRLNEDSTVVQPPDDCAMTVGLPVRGLQHCDLIK